MKYFDYLRIYTYLRPTCPLAFLHRTCILDSDVYVGLCRFGQANGKKQSSRVFAAHFEIRAPVVDKIRTYGYLLWPTGAGFPLRLGSSLASRLQSRRSPMLRPEVDFA